MFRSNYYRDDVAPSRPWRALAGAVLLTVVAMVATSQVVRTSAFDSALGFCSRDIPQFRAQNALLKIERHRSILVVGDDTFLKAVRDALPSAPLVTLLAAELDFHDLNSLVAKGTLIERTPAALIFQGTPLLWSTSFRHGRLWDVTFPQAQDHAKTSPISLAAIREFFELRRRCTARDRPLESGITPGQAAEVWFTSTPRFLVESTAELTRAKVPTFMISHYDNAMWTTNNPDTAARFAAFVEKFEAAPIEVVSLDALGEKVGSGER